MKDQLIYIYNTLQQIMVNGQGVTLMANAENALIDLIEHCEEETKNDDDGSDIH